jgi:FkbM family methyltransferase
MKAIGRKLRAFFSRWLYRWGSLPSPLAPDERAHQYETCTVHVGPDVCFKLVVDPAAADPIAHVYGVGYVANDYLVRLLTRFTQRRARVLDLGAHIGTFALAAAALDRQVLAVDAARSHVDLLSRSIACSGHHRLRVVHAAVSDRPGTVWFREAGVWGMVAYPGLDAPLVEVDTITVDGLLRKARWNRVDFIKMDVEGSEIAALKGMSRLLSQEKAPVIVYECNGLTLAKYGRSTRELVGLLEEFGYTTYRIESERYLPYRAGDFQPESYLDVVAMKPVHERRIASLIGPPLTVAEIRERAVQEAERPHELHREYIARALEHAGPDILNDPAVRTALDRLVTDSSEPVRLAVQWWLHVRAQAA